MYDICIYFCLQRYVDIRIVFLLLRPAARCCCVVLMLSPSVSFCRCGFCSVCFVSDCWVRQTTRPAGRFASVFFCFDPFPTVVLLVELCVVLCCFGLCCVVLWCVVCIAVRYVLFCSTGRRLRTKVTTRCLCCSKENSANEELLRNTILRNTVLRNKIRSTQ